jgi:uncharacterized protein
MLRISADLELPLDAVTQAIGILARRGAGKTYTASVLVEEVIGAHLPVVILDPTGAWWGLRSSADGEKAGLPVVIFGGEHGDVPLEATAGKVIADVVIEHPGAYVIDLSGLESKAAEHRFAADFLERLYRAKATRREPLLVVVDEADGFAPQRPGPEQTRTLGALEAIVRRGRIRGLGVVLVTQRAAVLNKNVLTQIEVLVAMQTTGPQDRAAIDDWIKGNGTPEERTEVLGSLASLEQGEAWIWSPSWLRQLVRIRVRTRRTFDSSKTPEAGHQRVEPRAFARVDLEQLGERIRATAETAKANDPAVLRRRIAELERMADKPIVTKEVRVEVPVLNGQVEQLGAYLNDLRQYGDSLVAAGDGLREVASGIIAAIARVQVPVGVAQPVERRVEAAKVTRSIRVPDTTSPAVVTDETTSLGRAERQILATLASRPDGLTRIQISLLSGYSIKSSALGNALGRLRSLGLVSKGTDPIFATEEGVAQAGDVELLPPAGPELVSYWQGRLGKAEATILGVLVAAFPDDVGKMEIADRSGYSPTSSALGNALGRLRSLGLVEGFHASADLVGSAR